MRSKRKRVEPEVTDEGRALISEKPEEIIASTDKEHTFEASLTSLERQVVHMASKNLDLKPTGFGEDSRCVSVYKKEEVECTPQKKKKKKCALQRKVMCAPKKKVKCAPLKRAYGKCTKPGGKNAKVANLFRNVKKLANKSENLSHLTLSEESKKVIENLFMYYPPHDGEMEKKIFGRLSKMAAKSERTGDIFSKPLLKKEEIAKKLEALHSRQKNNADLRQVTEKRAKLPIALFENVIVSTVESHQVVLISGMTGCGKTTQVPQYFLDHMWGKGENCKIVCTQPRRISATSVAERISDERGESIGNDIGYTIRLDRKGGEHSSVVFCTNGVLLRVLVSGGNDRLKSGASKPTANDAISNLTHIIVDEIHERDRFSDLMLTILRDVLPIYPHLRLILMSATLDAERFSEYFGGCPIISVPGFTYPVKTFYLEDALSFVKSEENKPSSAAIAVPVEGPNLTDEDKVALDEAINLAWSNDEFGPLLDLVSSEGSTNVFNYQHSVTGLTPLMVFAGKGRVGDICMLLFLGVDCTLKAKDGTTALVLAERGNWQEAADVIKKHMEDSNNVEEQRLLAKYLSETSTTLVDVVLIVQLLVKICMSSEEGGILVFLPGWDEIVKIQKKLEANSFVKEDPSRFMILPLHSMVPPADQKMVFRRPNEGCRKIVLSTNIAETSITIDDIVYVIDSGRMKESGYDAECNVSTLETTWVSKANARQRAGRAGRCQPGICYHMYSKTQALLDFQIPEIKRLPIEELCLQVKLMNPNGNIAEFLYKTLDPPSPKAISNALTVLRDVGALTIDEKLTELGEKLGSLPIHPRAGRMLLFSILMKCLDPALTLACASDMKDPFLFSMSPAVRKGSDEAKKAFAALYGGQSDQLAVVAAFDCYKAAKQRQMAAKFCSQFFLSPITMKMLHDMRKKLLTELIRQGFIPNDVSSCNVNARNPGILHALLVAGLYPAVGRLCPPHLVKRYIEVVNGDRVRLYPKSQNIILTQKKTKDCPTFVFDGITRGDFGLFIRKCTVIGPLPLLLFAADIAVVPAQGDKQDDTEVDKTNISKDGIEAEKNVDKEDDMDEDKKDMKEDPTDVESKVALSNEEKIMSSSDKTNITKDGIEAEKNVDKEDDMDEDKKDMKEDPTDVESKVALSNEEKIMSSSDKTNITKDGIEAEKNVDKEDGMDEDKKDMKEDPTDVESKVALSNDEKIMSSSDNSVLVYVDNWLSFKSTALEVAQIYCLKDRLSAAISYTANGQGSILPPVLADSASAIALLLSRDGLCGISEPPTRITAHKAPAAVTPKPIGDADESRDGLCGISEPLDPTRITAHKAPAAVTPKPIGDADESAPATTAMGNSLACFLTSLLRLEPIPKNPSPEPETRYPNSPKPPARPASLVRYGASRFVGPYRLRARPTPKNPSPEPETRYPNSPKPPAIPASLVGYGATRFGPYRLRARPTPKNPSPKPETRYPNSPKPPAIPASLVGYGATRFGPYGLRAGPTPAKRLKTSG